jgi:hypothetical protein
MRGKPIELSLARRVVCDLLHFALQVPTNPVQRKVNFQPLIAARHACQNPPAWMAIVTKAYAVVANEFPVLRRAYVKLPWPRLYEYPASIASVTVERDYQGEKCVFIGQIKDPAATSLVDLDAKLKHLREAPVESITAFRRALQIARWPWPVRRLVWWLGLNLPRPRANKFGTFALTVVSPLGAESIHPHCPLTSIVTYGIFDDEGKAYVRIGYDHRVTDEATIARALVRLEEVLHGEILGELTRLSELPTSYRMNTVSQEKMSA